MKLTDRKPDIENLYKVLRREKPARPVLFELFLNNSLYQRLAGREYPKEGDLDLEALKLQIEAFAAGGYDYASTHTSGFHFEKIDRECKSTFSLNDGSTINDETSFEAYDWPDPENYDYSRLKRIEPFLPDGMKLMVLGPGGLLENLIGLVGYDNLCFMLYDNPELVRAIVDNVGSRLLKNYEAALQYDTVGLLMINDDWGFKTQTFLSPDDMRKYIFPWHKKMVEAAHKKGIPAALHSCGYAEAIMEDIIEDIGFDGRHSYEDAISPVEVEYEKYHNRIAIMGGIDLDFIIKSPLEKITERSRNMLKRSEEKGSYMLGTGNSVPEYIPEENYFAMIKTALTYS